MTTDRSPADDLRAALAKALLETNWWTHGQGSDEWTNGELADAILLEEPRLALSQPEPPDPLTSTEAERIEWYRVHRTAHGSAFDSQPEPPEPSGGETIDALIEDTFGPDEMQAIETTREWDRRLSQKSGARQLAARLATPSPSPAELDVEIVHRITCERLIEHEPGSNEPYRWPCWDFAAAYAALRRTP